MQINVSEKISAPRERVWKLITDADRWEEVISGIVDVEILERPVSGNVGLRWRETRMLFGKEAIETMTISAEEPGQWYEVLADNHGTAYRTRVSVDGSNGQTTLSMQFTATPLTLPARLMSGLGYLFRGQVRKMLQQDLADIRQASEHTP